MLCKDAKKMLQLFKLVLYFATKAEIPDCRNVADSDSFSHRMDKFWVT